MSKPKSGMTLEQMVVEAALVGAKVTVEMMPINYVKRAIGLFTMAQLDNHYLYFELAFTHVTDWMCWLVDKSKKAPQGEPASEEGFLVLAKGQGANADWACEPVAKKLQEMGYK